MKSVIDILQSISEYKTDLKDYDQIWENFKSQSNYFGLVAINKKLDVIAYGSIFIENKIRGGRMGHIEDIAVHQHFRNQGIGSSIIEALCQIANDHKCYKVSLSCKEDNLSFYQKCDFIVRGISLSKFF